MRTQLGHAREVSNITDAKFANHDSTCICICDYLWEECKVGQLYMLV